MPDLIHHILRKLNQLYGRNVTTVSDSVLRKLCEYTWPGNVRELENVISRAVFFMNVSEEIIENHHLPVLTDHQSMDIQSKMYLEKTLQQATYTFARDVILQVYNINHYNKTKTTKALDISVRNVSYTLEKYES